MVRVQELLPGERAEVEVDRKGTGAKVLWAHPVYIETPLPGRRMPPCPIVGRCGGCSFQHVREDTRLSLLVGSASLSYAGDGAPFRSLAPETEWLRAPSPFGYRQKAIFVPARRGPQLVLGAFARHSHSVVDLPDCGVLAPALRDARNRVLRALRGPLLKDRRPLQLPGDPPPMGTDDAALRAILLRGNRGGEVLLTFVHTGATAPTWFLPIARSLVKGPGGVVGVFAHRSDGEGDAVISREPAVLLAGKALIRERVGPLEFDLGPLSFFQVNPGVLDGIAQWVRDAVVGDGPVLDLYCGAGVLGLSAIHGTGRTLLGIDVDPAAIHEATAAAGRANLAARFIAGHPADHLASQGPIGALILDPPRSGCRPADLQAGLELRPSVVVLVSCHTPSLNRDHERICAAGYRLESLCPADLMPQTGHVEWLAKYRRIDG